MRSPFSVTLSVWQAIFLREALDRLFDMRGAWFWLLMEPVCHIGFLTFIRTVIRMHTAGGVDYILWIIVGLLAFFLYRRTYVQVMHAVDSNRSLFAYRQVKPFDPAIVRAVLEAFLMVFVSLIVLIGAGLLGHIILPSDPFLVIVSISGLWFLAIGFGLIASVSIELVPELEHILKLAMIPLYLISGVIFPLNNVPQPYRDFLMLNPIAHGVEAVRIGCFAYYHAVSGVSIGYLYAWAIVGAFIGLVLFRRFAVQLVRR